MQNITFTRKYLAFFVFSFMFLAVITAIGIIYGYSVEYSVANQTTQELLKTTEHLSILSIFFNNCYIALVAFIPIYGVISMTIVSFNTGYACGCIGQIAKISLSQAFSFYYLNIIFLIEYVAYSLAFSESLYLVYVALKHGSREFIERLRYDTWRIILLVVFLLFIGAVIEWFIITS